MGEIEDILNRGVLAWEAGNRASGLADLRFAAASGHPVACHNLGIVLSSENSGQYTSEAVSLFRLAAEAGHAASAFNAGQACRMGHGTKLDPVEAASLYLAAATGGHRQSATELGLLLASGADGVPCDLVAAYAWLYPGTHVAIGDQFAIDACARLESLISPVELAAAEVRGREIFRRLFLPKGTGTGSPIRTPGEAWLRARACLALAWKAFSRDPVVLTKLLDPATQGMLSPAEKVYISAPFPSAEDQARHSWDMEPSFILLWSLGGEPVETGFATQTSNRDVLGMSAALKPRAQAGTLQFRCDDEIIEAYGSLFGLATTVRIGTVMPGVDLDVVAERGGALSWLLSRGGLPPEFAARSPV